ncbi:hypothetical protein [Sporosarcina sp. A2]|uniref:hypothetical protein n=1 Tax=Sporosarcina sp. A2 TaxID=3393449 RepID=UPI003D7B1F86
MKVIYISLFTLLGLVFLSGCTNQIAVKDTKQSIKTEEVENNHEIVSENDTYIDPFKISETNSDFANLNDDASGTALRGVRYEVSLFSEKELTNEERISFNFEVVTESSLLKESLGPIQPLDLTDTRDGYVYTLVFKKMYRDYSKEELEKLNKERNFQILLKYEGVVKKVESL